MPSASSSSSLVDPEPTSCPRCAPTKSLGLLLGALALQLLAIGASGSQPLDQLEFRFIGPVGNRVPAVAGVPGQPGIYYAGAASGGLFKTRDGGVTWTPIFDDQDVASIGAIAVAPDDPSVVWVGTGETFIRSNVSIGKGVFLSHDGGSSWQSAGLDDTGRIGRIVVHPRDSDTAYVAALGHGYGPQRERGLFRTRDGGRSWEHVLFVDENTGIVDVLMNPANPRELFAAAWQFVMSTSGRTSGGSGSGIYRSRDGGDSWERLGNDQKAGAGLPKPPFGKIGLASSLANPNRVYALIETSSNPDFAPVEGWDGPGFQGVLWRSEDSGDSWRLINRDNTLTQRPLYYTRAVVAPDNADEITFLAVQQSLSKDGGRTIQAQNSGFDHHDMWIDPTQPSRRIVGHDGGVSITTNRGRSWFRPQLPIAQLYHVAVDDQVPYFVYGNRQDGPSVSGPSNTLAGREIPIGAWHSVGGCETGFAVPVPGRDKVWTGCYDGILELYDKASGQSRDVSVWPLAIESWAAADLRYRFQWTFPITLSPHDPETVYVGSQYLHRSQDQGQTWQQLSPDLTSDAAALKRRSGGLTLDDAGPTIAPVIFAIDESPLEPGLIWAGTNDGKLHVTRDAGATWTELTDRIPNHPELGTVSNIDASAHDPGTAYITIDAHQEGDPAPYVYKTTDFGASWQSLSADLPNGPLGYAHCIREDPQEPGLLFLGTHNHLWTSFDAGTTWQSLRSNLPPAPVSWIEVQQRFSDLVISTYGRGFYVLDDITPLRWIASQVAERRTSARKSTLLPVRDSYRLRSREASMSQPGDPAAGHNPKRGVAIHYELDEDVEEVAIWVTSSEGETIRTLDGLDTQAGLHRVWWDFFHDPTPEVRLRTPPTNNPTLELAQGRHRRLGEAGRFRVLAKPGRYTVHMKIADSEQTREMRLLQDPNSIVTAAELDEQFALTKAIESSVSDTARLINEIESLREQLLGLGQRLERHSRAEERSSTLIDETEGALEALEAQLFDLRLTGAAQDTLRWGRRLYARLVYLGGRVQKSDHPPTDAQRQVHEELSTQLDEAQDQLRLITSTQISQLNEHLTSQGVGGIVTEAPREQEDSQ